MYHVAVCDENHAFLEKLQQVVTEIFEEIDCNYSVEQMDTPQALREEIELQEKQYNIIFLSIDNDSGQAFRTAEIIRARDDAAIIILVSESCEQAAEGYKCGAYRWIVKNNLYTGVSEAIHSADNLIGGSRNTCGPVIRFKFLNNEDYDYISVQERDIVQLYIRNRRIILVTTLGNYELLQYPLNHYKKLINSEKFIIASRSHLVNFVHVEELRGDFFRLSSGHTVCIGSEGRVKQQVKEDYLRYLGDRRKPELQALEL
ncbi:LytTR family transcriptional regulator DNA-binding domain-containing protein [Paenibacillus sp. MMS20-IR301]|uniref:LytR/AlgR family response regulator transcription factor n=1 Tax=Paenibacillus sp. MMS20-IR301 TaxID=2895946 RepID=UPI0028ED7029|nr:LytTR family transcriptional regulator DNA-binding domain-containing protein [Paenibacillus sp. MMS20-IR301]WNS40841.1 LytTR family transcriptional regulator DNA-binding domain-containing protein [Paenibacillus sp. MMS20-IR301]